MSRTRPQAQLGQLAAVSDAKPASRTTASADPRIAEGTVAPSLIRHAYVDATEQLRVPTTTSAPSCTICGAAYATALLAAGLTMHAVAELLGPSPALVMARCGRAYAAEKAGSALALERFREGGS